MALWYVRVNNGSHRDYLDGEKMEAGAMGGYARLNSGDVIDPGEDMAAFSYRWTHVPSGKTGISAIACMDRVDFLNYLAHWNASNPGEWQYAESEETEAQHIDRTVPKGPEATCGICCKPATAGERRDNSPGPGQGTIYRACIYCCGAVRGWDSLEVVTEGAKS